MPDNVCRKCERQRGYIIQNGIEIGCYCAVFPQVLYPRKKGDLYYYATTQEIQEMRKQRDTKPLDITAFKKCLVALGVSLEKQNRVLEVLEEI
jgi:hypothetical protein